MSSPRWNVTTFLKPRFQGALRPFPRRVRTTWPARARSFVSFGTIRAVAREKESHAETRVDTNRFCGGRDRARGGRLDECITPKQIHVIGGGRERGQHG